VPLNLNHSNKRKLPYPSFLQSGLILVLQLGCYLISSEDAPIGISRRSLLCTYRGCPWDHMHTLSRAYLFGYGCNRRQSEYRVSACVTQSMQLKHQLHPVYVVGNCTTYLWSCFYVVGLNWCYLSTSVFVFVCRVGCASDYLNEWIVCLYPMMMMSDNATHSCK
jgi:hypothetical protein